MLQSVAAVASCHVEGRKRDMVETEATEASKMKKNRRNEDRVFRKNKNQKMSMP